MNTAKHTPGPWTIEKTSPCRVLARFHKHDKEPGHIGALCPEVFGQHGDEAKANAALIARAPELLEENERLRAALEEHAEQVFAILCSDYSGSLTERMEKAMVHVMAWRAALQRTGS